MEAKKETDLYRSRLSLIQTMKSRVSLWEGRLRAEAQGTWGFYRAEKETLGVDDSICTSFPLAVSKL